jgi:hypothetical protein
MSFALSQQTTWPCSVCGAESLWRHRPHEIIHQQTKCRSRFVCESCIDAVISGLQEDEKLRPIGAPPADRLNVAGRVIPPRVRRAGGTRGLPSEPGGHEPPVLAHAARRRAG